MGGWLVLRSVGAGDDAGNEDDDTYQKEKGIVSRWSAPWGWPSRGGAVLYQLSPQL